MGKRAIRRYLKQLSHRLMVRTSWCAFPAMCVLCHQRWTATVPGTEPIDALTCPNCGTEFGVPEHPATWPGR